MKNYNQRSPTSKLCSHTISGCPSHDSYFMLFLVCWATNTPTCTHPILINDVLVVVLTICECPTWMLKICENFILKLKFWTLWIMLKFPCNKEIDLCQVWHRRDFEIRVHASWLYVLMIPSSKILMFPRVLFTLQWACITMWTIVSSIAASSGEACWER
jgi:hypothetical protein